MPFDPDAVLARIGLDHRPASDAAGLAQVHRAYVSSIPYEALAIQLDEPRPLDVDAVAARVLAGTGRGGYCFELNGLLAALLEALGFDVQRRASIVGPRDEVDAPINHLALVVTADGARWLADAGLGEGPLDPVPLAGVHEAAMAWTVDGDWVASHRWCSFPGFRMGAQDVPLAAFEPHHRRLAFEPDSPFVLTSVLQRPADDHLLTLRARTLSRVGPDRDERRTVDDGDDLARTLRDDFGIEPDALDVPALWARLDDQHRRWLAAREG